MTIDEAAKSLREMRDNAAYGEVAIQAIIFAIKYYDQIEGLSLAELSSAVGNGPDTCQVELRYGVQLSKYVTLLRD